MPTLTFLIAAVALIIALMNRSATRRLGEDIDEIRASQFEIRTRLKGIQADTNKRIAVVHTAALKAAGKIPEKRVPYYITGECIACGSCIPECAPNAISEGTIFEIDSALCVACGKCATVCPVDACRELD